MSDKRVLVVGISGVTCSGKSTTSKELTKVLLNSKVFCQDDYFLKVDDPRHVLVPELNHINFDIITSLDMDKMTKDIQLYIANQHSLSPKIEKSFDNNQILCFPNEKSENIFRINESPTKIIVIEGFCIFNHKPLADLCDLKYYFTLEYDECFRRRIARVYEPPDCPGYFEKCAWPEHLKQLKEVKESINNIVYFNGNSKDHVEIILKDILNRLQ